MELNIPPKYRKDIENATNLLKNEGCKSIFLFGSLVTGRMHDNSDIDIGIRGLPKGKLNKKTAKMQFKDYRKERIKQFRQDEQRVLNLS